MAVADQPSGLLDIASSLTQDEIPFKLRCAICNKLAVNAFRLPCCDQAICETCQASLPETCPVCAHTPISPDLCKPNKALRTTLKAFLRTEEKKREKERQSATPVISNGVTPTDATPIPQETPSVTDTVIGKPVEETLEGKPPTAHVPHEEPPTAVAGAEPSDTVAENGVDGPQEPSVEAQAETEQAEDGPIDTAQKDETAEGDGPTKGDATDESQLAQAAEQGMEQGQGPAQMLPNAMGFNMGPGAFPNMAWNNGNSDFNPMAQFMSNGMFNFQNPMGMTMDPMAANQGMFGGYGMNMNGMNNGMNMGMNFDASQGMYGGWDGSQNNMWNGGQDKFNPNAFANGMGPQYGGPSGFGGYNMSQPNGIHAQMQQHQFPSQDFQNGYYGPGYGRGNFRGRGRGFVPGGRGRGGFAGHMQANYPPNANYAAFQTPDASGFNGEMPVQSQEGGPAGTSQEVPSVPEDRERDSENVPEAGQDSSTQDPSKEVTAQEAVGDKATEAAPAETVPAEENAGEEEPQLRGIPTIDSLDQTNAYEMMTNGSMGMPGHMGMGFGRGYMRGPFPGGRGGGFGGPPFMAGPNMQQEPRGQGVEGAPAAPRAMREGLPNTSVLRQRGFYAQGRAPATSLKSEQSQSATPAPPQEDTQARSKSKSRSRSRSRARSTSRPRSRSRSAARSEADGRRPVRQRSPTVDNATGDSERRRDRPRRPRREDKYDGQSAEDDRRSRSPSVDSRRSSHRRDKERDRRDARRSHRSRRLRSLSRSRSPSRNGDSHDADRLPRIPEDPSSRSESRASASRKERSSRREEERDRERDRDRDRDSKRRDRNRDRDRDREKERDRNRERDRDRDRDRDRYRAREKDRDRRERDRDRDRKRSRRDRTESPADSDHSTRHHSRRLKRNRDDGDDDRNPDRNRDRRDKAPRTSEAEKDPHTLEREARNRERLLKEQQRREAMNAESKAGRRREGRTLAGGRRLSYKYEDEETDSARAARVEKEREASRWA